VGYASKQYRLRQLVAEAERKYDTARRTASLRGQSVPVRHKCFVSYHVADIDAVTDFIETFNDVFIPRVVGASDSDHFGEPIDSDDEEYIKSRIGSKYLAESTVTIVYVGQCTWARKYVDWEIASSLRHGTINRRNGLFGITPSTNVLNTIPARLNDNLSKGPSYARYYYYPNSAGSLRAWIEDAFQARTTRDHHIDNSRALRKRNSFC
jgi:hypothetical protein